MINYDKRQEVEVSKMSMFGEFSLKFKIPIVKMDL